MDPRQSVFPQVWNTAEPCTAGQLRSESADLATDAAFTELTNTVSESLTAGKQGNGRLRPLYHTRGSSATRMQGRGHSFRRE